MQNLEQTERRTLNCTLNLTTLKALTTQMQDHSISILWNKKKEKLRVVHSISQHSTFPLTYPNTRAISVKWNVLLLKKTNNQSFKVIYAESHSDTIYATNSTSHTDSTLHTQHYTIHNYTLETSIQILENINPHEMPQYSTFTIFYSPKASQSEAGWCRCCAMILTTLS